MSKELFRIDVDGQLCYFGAKPQYRNDALALSIRKWQYIVDHYGEMDHGTSCGSDGGPLTCGLCMLYFDTDCKRCPIRLYTGKNSCKGTPYTRWSQRRATLNAAKDELDLLLEIKGWMYDRYGWARAIRHKETRE